MLTLPGDALKTGRIWVCFSCGDWDRANVSIPSQKLWEKKKKNKQKKKTQTEAPLKPAWKGSKVLILTFQDV